MAAEKAPTVDGLTGWRHLRTSEYGAVYEAMDIAHGRVVVVKTISAAATAAGHARSELEVNGRLAATGVTVPVFTSGELPDGGTYVVLERQPGGSLHRAADRTGGLSAEEWLETILQLCEAVNRIHERGIVHQDLKPGNVFVGPNGQIRLGDFGSASFSSDHSDVQADLRALLRTAAAIAPSAVLCEPSLRAVLEVSVPTSGRVVARRLLEAAAETDLAPARLRPIRIDPDATEYPDQVDEAGDLTIGRRWWRHRGVLITAGALLAAIGAGAWLALNDDQPAEPEPLEVTRIGPDVVAVGEQAWFAVQGPDSVDFEWSTGQGGFQAGSTFAFVPRETGAGRLRAIGTSPDGLSNDYQFRYVVIDSRPVTACQLLSVASVAPLFDLSPWTMTTGDFRNDCTYELRDPGAGEEVFVTFRWHRAESVAARELSLIGMAAEERAGDLLLTEGDTTTFFRRSGSGRSAEGVELIVSTDLIDSAEALAAAIHAEIDATEPPLRPSLQVDDGGG